MQNLINYMSFDILNILLLQIINSCIFLMIYKNPVCKECDENATTKMIKSSS